MFEREHHQRIAAVLQALDAPLLAAHGCLFGGGTAIALRHGEYRESMDIDFVVSRADGYRALRQLLTGSEGMAAILRSGTAIAQAREVRADQYGIRTLLQVDTAAIKFEIVLEGRIELEPPGSHDVLCGVATLTLADMACTKLLANSDRWRDEAVFSRDLIDLAMMGPGRSLMQRALAKAESAYGPNVRRDLARAIGFLRERPHHLDRCMQAMRMIGVPRALLWQRIRAVERAAR